MPGFLANTGGAQQQATNAASASDKAKNETLFGPALGAVQPAPDWTNVKASTKDLSDELTPEIVRSWIAKSKDPSQPTTTLQALVNLKRPTLRLSPLTDDPAHHAIEFDYDADSSKCSVQVHVFTPAAPTTPILVYEHIVEGGFAKSLKLEDDAVLELAKYEFAGAGSEPSSTGDKSADITASNATTVPQAESSEAVAPVHATSGATGNRKRFSAFPFRKRQSHLPTAGSPVTAGPALQVVDVDATAPSDGLAKKDEDGVRVTIRLEALDDEEHSLPSVNTQTTYLHIVRMGTKPENADDEDNRPWIVKVVKREATIGYHTFHLHEIYGLTSSTSNASAPPPATTYPPTSSPTQAQDTSYDFAGQECVLCLSSPREVVLLPCRHLVACKECAINMVEFGAGGTLHHAAEPEPTPPVAEPTQEQTATAENATTAAPNDTPAAPAPVVPVAPRRKRKAKGWFCPVCRQPYTSLLRITTSPPDLKPVRDSEDGGDPLPIASAPPTEQDITAAERPSFLRSLSRAFAPNTAGTPQPGAAPAEVPGHVV